MSRTWTIRMDVPEESIVNAFISACEGGSKYWCKAITPRKLEGYKDCYWAMLGGFHVEEQDEDAAEVYVSPKDIQTALNLLVTETKGETLTNIFNGDADAEEADIFLQLCTFQRIVYG